MAAHSIHLGFEVGTGEPVSIPLDHLIITGRTQAAGKTTTLDAIVERSGLRTLTFLTKPGEDTFRNARRIRPYFHDEGGWRFVASVLEATLGEKLKQERAEIINATKGTRSLRDVYKRVVERKEKTRSGFIQDILTRLEAYLEIVLPQIERTSFASRLEIGPGANVIDMSKPDDFSDELQSLVMRSALGWILKHEKNVLTVIPEAWKFLPNARGNPVKDGCRTLIRQGGALGNWIAIDSQEITSLDAGIRKSVGVWILGVQRELNEAERVVDQLPGRPKPKVEDVMTLGLGQFFVSYSGAATRKVYVQPVWLSDEAAHAAAVSGRPGVAPSKLGRRLREISDHALASGVKRLSAEEIRKRLTNESEEDEMASEDVKRLEGKLDELTEFVRRGMAAQNSVNARVAPIANQPNPGPSDFDEEALFQRFKARLLKEPAVLRVLASQPEIVVETEKRTLEEDGSSLRGRIARLIAQGFFDEPKPSASAVRKELKRTGGDSPETNITPILKEYQKYGFLTLESEGWKSVREMKTAIRKKGAGS